ncbi:MAG: hypothetical protein AAFW60_00310 [Pseudomonadota bacterium]
MNGKRTSAKANGVRLVLAAKTSILEPSKRIGTLEALGLFADIHTKFSTCSLTALAAISRQSTRNVNRAFQAWREQDLQSLVIDLGENTGGPGTARMYRVHWERLRLVGAAIGVARRAVGAGAYAALDDRGLLGSDATLENCGLALSALQIKLLAEQRLGPARRIERLQSRLSSVFEGWPERILDQARDLDPRPDFEHSDWFDFDQAQSVDKLQNPDNLSSNPDKLSSRGNKEDSPQGDHNAFQPTLFSETELMSEPLAALAAMAGGSAGRRAQIAEALVGCQAGNLDGWLVIRASGQAQCDQLYQVWFGDLLQAAQKRNYRGLLITDRTINRNQSRVGGDGYGQS